MTQADAVALCECCSESDCCCEIGFDGEQPSCRQHGWLELRYLNTTQPITHDPAAVDSPAMQAWCADLNTAGNLIATVSRVHRPTEHAVMLLQRAFRDIALSADETRALIAGFAEWCDTPLATLERIAPLWAAWHGAGEGM